MNQFFDMLEAALFTNLIGEINLYTLIATGLKFIFVIIVLRFIYTIVKMITLDIRSNWEVPVANAPYLKLLQRTKSFDFPIQSEYYLTDNVTVGRADDNSIVLKDPRVSKHQARIVRSGERYYIDDLGSTNGTRVNDQRVEEPVELHSQDRILLGSVLFAFVDEQEL